MFVEGRVCVPCSCSLNVKTLVLPLVRSRWDEGMRSGECEAGV